MVDAWVRDETARVENATRTACKHEGHVGMGMGIPHSDIAHPHDHRAIKDGPITLGLILESLDESCDL